jgi:U6 snRNA-associated Sm-like protein LSm8
MVGLLHSCDGSMNLVLQEAVERIIRPIEDEEPSEEVPLGLYIILGEGSRRGAGRNETYLSKERNHERIPGVGLGSWRRGFYAASQRDGLCAQHTALEQHHKTSDVESGCIQSASRQATRNGKRIYMHTWTTRYPRKRNDTLSMSSLINVPCAFADPSD